jgi:hypothetical protein
MKVELSNNEDTGHYSELTRELVAAGGRTQWLIESRKFTVCGDPKLFATNVIGPLRLIAPLVIEREMARVHRGNGISQPRRETLRWRQDP